MQVWNSAVIAAAVAVTVLVVVVVTVAQWRATTAERGRRTDRLRATFGGEYDEIVARAGRRQGEAELEERARDLGSFDAPAIEPILRAELAERWARVQLSFVDRPDEAVRRAGALVAEALRRRHLPADTFDERAASVALEVPDHAAAYQRAHDALGADPGGERELDVAALRQALLDLRATFEDLLDRPDHRPEPADGSGPGGATGPGAAGDAHGPQPVDRFG
ncbi:MAG TPA: hypothetical protein VK866_05240 [Acidimicrobiales bacterium]|nr:hypothetical protein [Acidimicrobiales bacterium]